MELYTHIDEMPIYNWFKCIESKDYTYCLIKRKVCVEDELNECMDAFNEMYCQYIDTFGIGENLQEILRLKNQILSYKIDIALTNDTSIQTFIDIKEIELNGLMDNKGTKTNTAKVAIEKYLGFRLNEKEVTVSEYYNYLKAIQEDNGRATDKE